VIAEVPHPWQVLHDDAKSYITLASALLGVTATFANDLVSDENIARWLVFGGWAALAASILLSILASGKVFGGIKASAASTSAAQTPTPKPDYNKAVFRINVAVYALGFGVVLLAVGAFITSFSNDEADPPSPVEVAKSTVADMAGDDAELTVTRVEQSRGDEFVVLVEEAPGGTTYEVTVDDDDGEATKVRTL
jgi:hypothetical protein